MQNQIKQLLPFSIESEQILLGSILLRGEIIEEIEEFLKPSHFYDEKHKKIYATVLTLFNKKQNVNVLSVYEFLKSDVEAEITLDYLSPLTSLSYAIPYTSVVDLARNIHEYAIKRNLIIIAQDMINNVQSFNLNYSSSEQIVDIESKLFTLSSSGQIGKNFISLNQATNDAIEAIDRARKHPNHITGISSGLIDLDKLLGGFQKSDLIIVAGRPSMGKTSFAINLALNAAKNKEKETVVGLFSLEMSTPQIVTKMLSINSEVELTLLKTGLMREEQYNQIRIQGEQLSKLKLFIDDTAALSLSNIKSRSKRLKRQHGLDILVIDYLQLIHPNSRRDSRVLEISEVTQGLKALAKELDIPVIALSRAVEQSSRSQLSRAVEQRQDKNTPKCYHQWEESIRESW